MGAQYNFGVGYLTLIPPAGSSDLTPQPVGTLKDASLDITFTTKQLIGQSLFPVDIARSAGKISGKAKSGEIKGALLTSILTGATLATGQTIIKPRESTGVLAGSPPTYTAVPGSGWSWTDDLGAFDETGKELKKVTTTPNTGEYKAETGGVYTFATGAAGKTFSVTYSKKSTTVGKTTTYQNQLMGTAVVYQLALFNHYSAWDLGLKLFACIIPKLSMAFKNEDYTDTDIDFEAFADANGDVLEFYSTE